MPDVDFHEALDLTLAYFVWCHSVRDWLIKDCAVTSRWLDDQLLAYPVWKIVRDIANRSKHLRITRNPTDADWVISREYDHFAILIEGRERHHMILYFNGKKERVSDVVRRAARMWDEIVGTAKLA